MCKLLTLKPIRVILKILGLLYDIEKPINHSLIGYLPNIIYTIPLLSLLFPLIAYFYYNMDNLTNATDVFYVIAATLLCIGQYWFLVVQKRPLFHLLAELQLLVDQSNDFVLSNRYLWLLSVLAVNQLVLCKV